MVVKNFTNKFEGRKYTLITHLVIVLLFTFVYAYYLTPEDFIGGEQLNDISDYLYFSVITHASVGYGDILPKTKRAKIIVTSHVVLSFIFIVSLWFD